MILVPQSGVTAAIPHSGAKVELVGGGEVGASPVTEGSLLGIAPRGGRGGAERQPLLFAGGA